MKGGDGLFEDAALIGLGAYAARQPGGDSVSGLVWNVAKIGMYIGLAILAFFLFIFLLGYIMKRQHFTVPERPSAHGDQKVMTPAGNTIIY